MFIVNIVTPILHGSVWHLCGYSYRQATFDVIADTGSKPGTMHYIKGEIGSSAKNNTELAHGFYYKSNKKNIVIIF